MVITKGILNKVGFTLSELAICDEPMEFRIVFISENSPSIFYELTKTPVNLSKRLQVFEIDEGVEVDFQPEGYYTCMVYQTTSDNLVDTTLVRVLGQEEQIPTISSSTNTQVYVGE